MNNWKAIGYIFLGFGSVFLGYTLIACVALISLNPTPVDFAPIALVANAPWFILAALAYVVGFVGYFAGKEDTIQENIREETVKPAQHNVSTDISPLWSFPTGVFTTLASLALHLALGFRDNMTYIFGVPSPVFVSVIAGVIVGFVTLLVLYGINQR